MPEAWADLSAAADAGRASLVQMGQDLRALRSQSAKQSASISEAGEQRQRVLGTLEALYSVSH